MGTQQYKNYIKMKVKETALKYLTEEQESHSKVKHIEYEKLEIQPYQLFSRKKTLFIQIKIWSSFRDKN